MDSICRWNGVTLFIKFYFPCRLIYTHDAKDRKRIIINEKVSYADEKIIYEQRVFSKREISLMKVARLK